MGKLDPGLKFLIDTNEGALADLAEKSIFAVETVAPAGPKVRVLVQFTGAPSVIEEAGVVIHGVAGDVATGEVELSRLPALEDLPEVTRVEVSRVLKRELDLALPEAGVNAIHSGPPGHRGAGVVVAIIDSGIDYQHQAFRRSDGTSRIIAIWDQGLAPVGSERSPEGFSYGVEYRRVDIDAALASPAPLTRVRHQDQQIPGDGFHGTHVAGIAAGDGSVAGSGRPAFTFVGVAPEAEIVVVANNRGQAAGERGLGDSADTLDAVVYILRLAASIGRPVVINQSQGDNVGPHDGTSLLERGIDNVMGAAGHSMVKSAGNEGARNRHASGTVTAVDQRVRFDVPSNASTVVIDLWYGDPDRLDVSLTPPGGVNTAVVSPGTTRTIDLPGGNKVFVDSDLNDPGNNDHRIFIAISRGSAGTIKAGTWSFTLHQVAAGSGRWDAWIQRNSGAQFLPPFQNPARTISVPGTAREVITVGSYITRGPGSNSISSFSSLGPTRDQRQAPTVAAPGQTLIAPQPLATGDAYGPMAGTSMAAPIVTGLIALMLQRNPALTQAQIAQCLMQTARADEFTGPTPNNAWGGGKVDASAAFSCEPGAGPGESEAVFGGVTGFWRGNPGY